MHTQTHARTRTHTHTHTRAHTHTHTHTHTHILCFTTVKCKPRSTSVMLKSLRCQRSYRGAALCSKFFSIIFCANRTVPRRADIVESIRRGTARHGWTATHSIMIRYTAQCLNALVCLVRRDAALQIRRSAQRSTAQHRVFRSSPRRCN